MQTLNIFTNEKDSLPHGKADFLLAASVTRTNNSNSINLTPTLDAEFITNEKLFANSPQTLQDISIPAIITRAVHNLAPFSTIEILNLGLDVIPEHSTCHNFGLLPSGSIKEGAQIDVRDVFCKGMDFGKSYELKGNYLILADGMACGTATAIATALALGYDCNFSSSLQDETVTHALSLLNSDMTNIEKLSLVSDNMLIFCAGFLLEASRRFHVVLGGGLQMAVCLLVADKLREDVFMRVKDKNITLATTAWVVHDSNIAHLLSLLSFIPHAAYTTFSFKKATILALHKYDEEARDGVGAGAALAFAHANSLDNDALLEQIEYILYKM
ncbi:MAG: nicotinate-nucleotide--dimethylbenzimidazole phosphoribosyltransferase [Campylobacterales bacterium]|nr:nicotinate-nucleotide--dimethylbenzimidazole phosphoribosyltransferase [Campylobacterales bacterium]